MYGLSQQQESNKPSGHVYTRVEATTLCHFSDVTLLSKIKKKNCVCVHGQGVFVHVRVCEFIQVSAGAHRDLRHQNLA